MRTARGPIAAGVVAGTVVGVAVALAPARARADEGAAAATPDAALAARPEPESIRARAYPLVFLFQGDALLGSTPDADAAASSEEAPDGSALRLRRLRVGDDVSLGAWRVRAALEVTSRGQSLSVVDGGRLPAGGVARLPEAFAAWAPHRALQVTVGGQRVPFSLSRLVDEADLRLPERAQAIAALAPDYRAGATVRSDLGLLDLRAGFFSSDTAYDGHLFTAGWLGVVRLSADPIGPMGATPWRRPASDPWTAWTRFSAGVSLLLDHSTASAGPLAIEADGQVQARRFTATAEYVAEHSNAARALGVGRPGALGWPDQGAVVEPGVFVVAEHVELVLRGAWYRRPRDGAADPHATTDTLAGGAGLTLITYDAHVRLQAAFELRRTLAAALPDSSWAIFRATFVL